MPAIYHLTSRADLEAARSSGSLVPGSLPTQGFTHCCFRDQITLIANAVLTSVPDLMALELDPHDGDVRIEPPDPTIDAPVPPSSWFPHLYGPVVLDKVIRELAVPRQADGFSLPPSLQASAAADEEELQALLSSYDWYDHPEGPKFVETHRDTHRTNGHWLFLPEAISAWHRVENSEELWYAQRGRLHVHVLQGGQLTTHVLGLDVARGEKPVLAVPRNALQAAELAPGEPFAFGSNACAPAFSFEEFSLPDRASLIAAFPDHAALITRLTHPPAEGGG